jgi:hypothetical protein
MATEHFFAIKFFEWKFTKKKSRAMVAESSLKKSPLDKLCWEFQAVVETFQLKIKIRTNNSPALEKALEKLPFGWKFAETGAEDFVFSIWWREKKPDSLFLDDKRIAKRKDDERIIALFETFFRLTVAEFAPDRVFIHAGVVGWKNRAIIIPAKSYGGKSTMVAALVKAGAEYYSDEFAVIDKDGMVHPFPKPLSWREPDSYRQTDIPIETLGGKQGLKPLPVGLVLLTSFEKNAQWNPNKISLGNGILAILEHTVTTLNRPSQTLGFLHESMKDAEIWQGPRGEADKIAIAILQKLG